MHSPTSLTQREAAVSEPSARRRQKTAVPVLTDLVGTVLPRLSWQLTPDGELIGDAVGTLEERYTAVERWARWLRTCAYIRADVRTTPTVDLGGVSVRVRADMGEDR